LPVQAVRMKIIQTPANKEIYLFIQIYFFPDKGIK
jgi:hypothetical protein